MAWLKRALLIGLLVNVMILITNFFAFRRFEHWFNGKDEFRADSTRCVVEVWSKASIGDYLWEHILRGEIQKNVGAGYYRFGKVIDSSGLVFKFRSGFSITPDTVSKFFSEKKSFTKLNLILVMNGRTKSYAERSQAFIHQVKQFKNLNLGVVLLGNENCFNNWIKQHLDSGLIKFLFVVYDWNQVNNVNIFQWPLGVATYRNFSHVQITKNLIKNERNYLCNYLATIYKNSSREELYHSLNRTVFGAKCLMNVRMQWSPNETNESSIYYKAALRNSDLTLSPLGRNHECYRIYEAFAYLSIPILEENLNHVKKSSCDQHSTYRLLKEFHAPVRFVSNWTVELNRILLDEIDRTLEERMNRRIQVYSWYESFKNSMRSRLVRVINEKFDCG